MRMSMPPSVGMPVVPSMRMSVAPSMGMSMAPSSIARGRETQRPASESVVLNLYNVHTHTLQTSGQTVVQGSSALVYL